MGSTFKKRDEIAYQLGEAQTEEEKKSIRTTIEKNPDAMSEEGICKYFKIKKLEDMTMVQMREWLRLINEGGKKK